MAVITTTAVAAIISAIASAAIALSVVDSSAGAISSAIKQKDNKAIIKDLSEKIAKDQQLASELVDAYNRRGADYANQILNRSPFGTAYDKLNKAIINNSQDLKKANSIQREVDIEANRALTEAQSMPSGSGSIIGDLIAGGTSSPNYQDRQTELSQMKEKL